jgi:hypothetical protein
MMGLGGFSVEQTPSRQNFCDGKVLHPAQASINSSGRRSERAMEG